MKKRLFIVAFLIASLSMVAIGGGWFKTVFKGQTFLDADTGTDTSSSISLSYMRNAELVTSVYGLDSGRIIIDVDGYMAGRWQRVGGDTILPATAASGGYTLRGEGTNILPGVELVRIRNTMSQGDSVSATYYDQYILVRD